MTSKEEGDCNKEVINIRFRISVIGSSGNITRKLSTIAKNVGKEIGIRGAILITGGKDGVMEASSQGAKSVKGLTIGILPESISSSANPFVDIPIATGIGYARNFITISSSDAIISIAGLGGTLSEIGFAIALNKRLILLEGTGGVTEMMIHNKAIFPNADIHVAKTVQEAVNLAYS